MSSLIYSRPAFLAEEAFRFHGIAVGKGHLRELISALHGYSSLAALKADEPLNGNATPHHTLVLIDKPRALDRCRVLLPSLNPQIVIQVLIDILQHYATPSHFYMRDLADMPKALIALGRYCVLKSPEMDGVLDQQANDSIWHYSPSEEAIHELSNESALRAMHENTGSVRILDVKVEDHVIGKRILLVGDYTDAQGENGEVSISLIFQRKSPVVFFRHSAGVMFTPAETHGIAFKGN